MLATARTSANVNDFALVAMLGLLGLRIFEACGASIADLGEEHGHRVLRVHGNGGRVVLTPLAPAVARAIDRAVDGRVAGPILRTSCGTRLDRHCATLTSSCAVPSEHPADSPPRCPLRGHGVVSGAVIAPSPVVHRWC